MSLCRGFRSAAWLQLGAIRQPFILGRPPQARKLSTLLLINRIQWHTQSPCSTSLSRRDYWWTSKSATPEPTVVPLPQTNEPAQKAQQENTQSSPKSDEALLDDSVSTLTPTESSIIVDPGISVVPDISSISVPPPPLQLGDLRELGFSNFTPVGAVQAALEFVQVTTGLPWWGTIVVTTVLTRIIGLHWSIKSARATAAMGPVRSQIDALMAEAQSAAASGDKVRGQLAALKVRKIQQETGTGPASVLPGPVIQAVTSISMFLAIKKLCDFPLAQLKYEGFAWLPSLATADPYYILPTLSVVLVNLQIYLGRTDMAAGGSKAMHFSNIAPVLSVVSLGFLAYMPSGLLIYLMSNVALVSIQAVFLRNPAIRRSLKIPPLVRPKPEQIPSMKETWSAIKDWFANKQKQAVLQAEQRAHIPTFPAQSSNPTPLRRTPLQRSPKQPVRGRKV